MWFSRQKISKKLRAGRDLNPRPTDFSEGLRVRCSAWLSHRPLETRISPRASVVRVFVLIRIMVLNDLFWRILNSRKGKISKFLTFHHNENTSGFQKIVLFLLPANAAVMFTPIFNILKSHLMVSTTPLSLLGGQVEWNYHSLFYDHHLPALLVGIIRGNHVEGLKFDWLQFKNLCRI